MSFNVSWSTTNQCHSLSADPVRFDRYTRKQHTYQHTYISTTRIHTTSVYLMLFSYRPRICRVVFHSGHCFVPWMISAEWGTRMNRNMEANLRKQFQSHMAKCIKHLRFLPCIFTLNAAIQLWTRGKSLSPVLHLCTHHKCDVIK